MELHLVLLFKYVINNNRMKMKQLVFVEQDYLLKHVYRHKHNAVKI